jgi:hypothetical protein
MMDRATTACHTGVISLARDRILPEGRNSGKQGNHPTQYNLVQ